MNAVLAAAALVAVAVVAGVALSFGGVAAGVVFILAVIGWGMAR